MWKDSETELDFLDYEYLVKSLQSIVKDDALLPASVGVYGDWGSGKSSLMHMCKKRLEADDKNIKCLMFNGWLFENYEDAKTAILGSILDEISQNRRLGKRAEGTLKALYESVDKLKLLKSAMKYGAEYFLTGGVGTLASIAVEKVAQQVQSAGEAVDTEALKKAVTDELENKELRENIRKFQAQFAQLLKETNISRLVVFIDELDRCRPDTILDTLEAIKLFLFNGKVAFVIGADERHISYAVKSKFKDIEGIQINIGQEYLEKLIQYPLRIPRLNPEEVETYLSCLLLQSELSKDDFNRFISNVISKKQEDFEKFDMKKVIDIFSSDHDVYEKVLDSISVAKQLSPVLSTGLHGNPRQCKRFLNSLYMRLDMASYKGKDLDRKVLAKIMLLEYIKPLLFNEIAKMTYDGTLASALEVLENGTTGSDVGELKRWKEDSWFMDWCKIQPKLLDTDLKLYFYFSRTSLDEKISRISSVLSPTAQGIIDKLLSKSEMKLQSALEEAKDISNAEAATILEAMYTTMTAETNISNERFEAFIKFATSREELYADTLSYLKSFTGNQIPLGSVAYIEDFAKKSNRVEEIREIAHQWGSKNNNILRALEASLS